MVGMNDASTGFGVPTVFSLNTQVNRMSRSRRVLAIGGKH